jgi:hypothetical protein
MATVALVAIDALVYSQLRVILPFTLALTAWLIGVASGHHLREIVAWASSSRDFSSPLAAVEHHSS